MEVTKRIKTVQVLSIEVIPGFITLTAIVPTSLPCCQQLKNSLSVESRQKLNFLPVHFCIRHSQRPNFYVLKGCNPHSSCCCGADEFLVCNPSERRVVFKMSTSNFLRFTIFKS